MSAATGIIGGALGLATLQLVLSNQRATTALGKLATVPAALLEKFMDPSTPAIPDHSVAGPSTSPSASAAPSSYPATGAVPTPSSPQTLSV